MQHIVTQKGKTASDEDLLMYYTMKVIMHEILQLKDLIKCNIE